LVFEPHTFSRIRVFFDAFAKNLSQAQVDSIFITEVYAAREQGNSKKLARKLASAVGGKAVFSGNLEKTAQYLKKHLKEFDIVLSMGAGRVYKLWDLLNSN